MKISCILPLLLLGLGGDSRIMLAQSAGTFTATGSMITNRFGHTATLLANGKVLIAGGYTDAARLPLAESGDAITATAELYDADMGTFTATGNMVTARAYHTATLLPDGRVLIAGGSGRSCCSNVADAELYDPSTATFSATGSMTIFGECCTATLLPEGQVLTIGLADSAELYDPALGTFMATSTMTVPPRGVATATLLPNGQVLLVGDFTPALYDPVTGRFSLTGTATDTWDGMAVLLANGNVLFAGGSDESYASPGAEVYDPSIGVFTVTGNMSDFRAHSTATLLPDGKALIVGGSSIGFSCCLASAELYDPSTGLFANTGSLAAGRSDHTATLLNTGKVLITGGGGGYRSDALAVATAELYTPATLIPAPMLFLLAGDGQGQGAIWHAATGQIAWPGDPAGAGEILSLYTVNLAPPGSIPPRIAVGGRLAEILFFGDAPGFPGYFQVNFRVPAGQTPASVVSVQLTYLGRSSNEVTIGVGNAR